MLIFQQCVQIFAWNFTQLLSNKIYTLIPKFCWNMSENGKIMRFQPRQLPTSQHSEHWVSSPVICWWLWKEPVCRWWNEDADLQMDRVTADVPSDDYLQPQPCRGSTAWWSSPSFSFCVIFSCFIVTVQFFLFKCYSVNMCDWLSCVINAYLLTYLHCLVHVHILLWHWQLI